jgi:MerR family copper efflux transcriptional regulator
VAEVAGVTTKTLRYYETAGSWPNRTTPAGYRDYPESVLDRLRFIRASQAAGLSLGQIKGIIAFRDAGQPPCGHVLQVNDDRAAGPDDRIAELTALRDELRRLARRSRSLSPDACSPSLVCHILSPGAR